MSLLMKSIRLANEQNRRQFSSLALSLYPKNDLDFDNTTPVQINKKMLFNTGSEDINRSVGFAE